MSSPTTERQRLSDVLRHRDFALLWSGQAVSLVGDGVFTIALALEALHLSHSPALLAVVVAVRMVPLLLLLLVAGALTDRLPRRITLLGSDAVRGAAVLVVTILIGLHALHPAELVAMAAVFGCADAFFFPAMTAIVPEIVPAHLLTQANSLSFSTSVAAQSLVGPALGGLLIGVIGISGSFGVDAASFGLSAISLGLMRARDAPVRTAQPGADQSAAPEPRPSLLADAKEGLRFTFRRQQRWLWVTLIAAALGNAVGFVPLGVLTPLLVERVLHGSGVDLGLVVAAGGLGGALGAILAGRLGTPRHRVAWMWLSWSMAALCTTLRGLATSLVLVGVLGFVSTGLLFYGETQWRSLMQTLVPRDLLGRVSSVDWLFSLALSPIGALLAGVLAGTIGVRTSLVIGGAIAAAGGACLFVPGVRAPDRQPFEEPERPPHGPMREDIQSH